MIIGVLTSSRADYGIYLPLLRMLKSDKEIDLRILAFGTHLSSKYGTTVNNIIEDGFNVYRKIETLPESDAPRDISLSIGKTITNFSHVWEKEKFDLVFALGDRYEMFAAVSSILPFNIPIAHIHGGETTLGAIDNAFRHSISCMANYHFVTTQEYFDKVREIKGSSDGIFNVGALSIDSLVQMKFLTTNEFSEKYGIDLTKPTILSTFHPETVNFEADKQHIEELIASLEELKDFQQVITMPNADTMGLHIRERLLEYAQNRPNVFCVESFGSLGYLSCMKHCTLMLGNTSSGFVEAAFFAKPVVNIGIRQKGRIETPNIITVPIIKDEILNAVSKALTLSINAAECQIYGDGHAAEQIHSIIKNKL